MKLLFVSLFSVFCISANQFSVIKDGQEVPVRSEHIDSILRTIKSEQDFESYFDHGHGIKIHKDEDGNYHMSSQIGLKGGGPISGACVYLGVKVVAYTSMLLGTMAANAAAPGAGGVATAIALGTGGVSGALVATEALAVKCGCAVALMPWCP